MITEISCKNCSALCCGPNQQIALTYKELELLKSAGTTFNQEGVPKLIRRFDFIASDGSRRIGNTYTLTQRCGFVVEKDGWLQCGLYGDSRRPFECGLYETGGEGCRDIRKAGRVKPISWHAKLLLKLLDL